MYVQNIKSNRTNYHLLLDGRPRFQLILERFLVIYNKDKRADQNFCKTTGILKSIAKF